SLSGLNDEPLPLDAALRGALWGNQADLSLWPADAGDGPGGAMLLADDGPAVLIHLDGLIARLATVDVVLDNAGAELVHDLLLADALLARGLRVRLHAKAHPTFVSDATVDDTRDTIAWLAERPGPVAAAGRLLAALATGRLTLHDDWFWTSPLAGWEMPEALYHTLATSGLLISKGDANYRRWLGDRHWPADTPLEAVLGYVPAPLLLLRTCKSEVAIGLDQARVAAATARDPQWMTSGRWGLVQFVRITP
ncbi:MAG: damage-control phosphatase ARMT1 family protein, partial [Chloroflexaceae bacterium]|nr:damage-control phosphatase ARMT1 family protein [Chloroflexaceae bacterium]